MQLTMQYALFSKVTQALRLISYAALSLMITNGCSQSTDSASAHTDLTNTVESTDNNLSSHEDAQDAQDAQAVAENEEPEPQVYKRENISQMFDAVTPTEVRLAVALPELPYEVNDLPEKALAVNRAIWMEDAPVDEALAIKIQALLSYHHHSVGAVDGRLGQNVVKAMQVFQEKQGLEPTGVMDRQTWEALTVDETINKQPVLVHYTLTADDVTIPYHRKGQQYHSVTEAVAEKFHMSQGLLTQLNPDTALKAGNKIVVYNPYQPNTTPVARVVANKQKNLLLAYDKDDQLVASYPTTMGSSYKPSPSGEYKVASRVIDPTYNRNFKNKHSVLPPGPNNPVGRVWIGINKPSYGIHGSPNPEKISQQNSAGCVRLTNWDALGLFGTIEHGAAVVFE